MGRHFDKIEKKPKENKTRNVRDGLLVLSLICLCLATIVFGLEMNSFHKLKRELITKASVTTQAHIDWFEITTHPEKVPEDSTTNMEMQAQEAESVGTTNKTQGATISAQTSSPEIQTKESINTTRETQNAITSSQKTNTETQKEVATTQATIPSSPSAQIQKHDATPPDKTGQYVINTKSKKIHKSNCRYVKQMKPENQQIVDAKDLQTLVNGGYTYCSVCCKSD